MRSGPLKNMKSLLILSGFLLLCMCLPQAHPAPSSSDIPMYGDSTRAGRLKPSDAAFIASIEKAGQTRQAVAKEVLLDAWAHYRKTEYAQAMRKFNQAWLLDPENGDAYHGFAVITLVRNQPVDEAEKYFRMALSKPGVNVNARVDYGRLLWIEGRLDESLAQLQEALSLAPKAHNARSNIAMVHFKRRDYAKACEFARAANRNGDDLPRGFLEDMCAKGATG
jgi:tetratricopeptide (TPR) repeat protein